MLHTNKRAISVSFKTVTQDHLIENRPCERLPEVADQFVLLFDVAGLLTCKTYIIHSLITVNLSSSVHQNPQNVNKNVVT